MKHGHSIRGKVTSTYMIWHGMKRRCQAPNNAHYRDYGARGITVCARWQTFDNFLSDMGERPEGLSLDRIDNDGPYCKENCRWITHSQQQRNGRNTAFFEFNGIRKCAREWEESLGLSKGALWHRLKKGWPPEKAFTERNRNQPCPT